MAGTKLADAYVQIIPSAEGIQGSISKVINPEAASAGESAGTTIAGKIKGMIAAAGIGVAIVSAIKSAVTHGAELEQSIGGIETLFGESADKMKEYASQAYKTAGISANDYMQQATSFSASLLQSLGGDTAKAAEAANQAIIDMGDNANKMGTDMQSIQNAYQGFAKGNYTMLDNLKLGYGGTRTEMQRLLEDAEKLTGVHYDISNLSDVYSAIHVIQEDLGITGTTALEASETLAGSFASMKAAAEDFMGNLALGENVTESLGALVDTAGTFLFDNLLPAVGNVLAEVPGLVATMVTDHLPGFVENGLQMVQSLAEGLANGIPDFAAKARETIAAFLKLIIDALPSIIESGLTILSSMTEGFSGGLPNWISAATDVLQHLITTIIEHLPEILGQGVEIIVQLAAGLVKAIPQLIAALPKIFEAIINGFKEVDWGDIGSNIIEGIKEGLKAGATAIATAAKNAAKSALDAAKNFLGIHSPSRVFRDQIGYNISAGLAEGIEGNAGIVRAATRDLANETTKGFERALGRTASVSSTLTTQLQSGTAQGDDYDDIIGTIIQIGGAIVQAIDDKETPSFSLSDRDVYRSAQRGSKLVVAGGY